MGGGRDQPAWFPQARGTAREALGKVVVPPTAQVLGLVLLLLGFLVALVVVQLVAFL